ncbi:hypothetical protein LC653_21285 [Nostoc sp. CHAB 5784]|uniref:Nmad2 family putative nucleotide modification protein n=1 Tax=Nostoc mirabile TaxID=2907820 RepID=UPI003555C5FD|nr:hypothetical protein [Nostoc mirabile CHAB5784]
MRLFSYCLRYDDGAAPNPFWELCTLAVCKPVIRRVASIGDWVLGFGSTQSPIGNIADYVVYAMRASLSDCERSHCKIASYLGIGKRIVEISDSQPLHVYVCDTLISKYFFNIF